MTTNSSKIQWQYLEKRPHRWRKQLYLQGTRTKASVIYSSMVVNNQSVQEAAEDWDLPLAAIEEVVEYCETHQELLKQEARAERQRLEDKGFRLEPKITY
ncbi:MAG: hypothetical protein QNJ34_18465 [Xenococcaceae cyanobacterium MO_188.B29]|nr:hypothetical protein [Xenococcaceae cyanobacterium MO_188.B29]